MIKVIRMTSNGGEISVEKETREEEQVERISKR